MLHRLLNHALEIDPDRPIVESDGSWTTSAELERLASRLASGLAAAGLEEGDRVAFLLPNCLEAIVCDLACFRMKFVVVPMDYQYHPLQVGYALGNSGASILIADHGRIAGLDWAGVLGAVSRVVVVRGGASDGKRRSFESLLGAERLLPSDSPHDDAPAVMIYTSGTTSRPKGVVLSYGARSTGVRKYLSRVILTSDDVALIATSISRPLALRCQVRPTLWAGGRVSLVGRFTVDSYVDALRRPPAKTFLTLTPASLAQLLASPDFHACDFSHPRLCLAGGDRVPSRGLEAFERLTGVPATEQCGSTETGPFAMNPPFGLKKPGSVGPPLHGVHVAVVNEQGADVPTGTVGDILVSGPGIMDGYWNDSAMTRKTLQRGWVHTGDLGRYDNDGYLWFVGRRKDVIVRRGNKVAPLEVEAARLSVPQGNPACRGCRPATRCRSGAGFRYSCGDGVGSGRGDPGDCRRDLFDLRRSGRRRAPVAGVETRNAPRRRPCRPGRADLPRTASPLGGGFRACQTRGDVHCADGFTARCEPADVFGADHRQGRARPMAAARAEPPGVVSNGLC